MAPSEHFLPTWRERVQLLDVEFVVTRSGSSEVTVHLGVPSGRRFTGQGAGLGHREGTMRAAVEATLRALAPLCAGRLELRVRGTRSLRAFDALLVIVALQAYPILDPDADSDAPSEAGLDREDAGGVRMAGAPPRPALRGDGRGAGPSPGGTRTRDGAWSEREPYRLIGTVAAPEEDLVRGTVMAVLDAANRVVEGYALVERDAGTR